MAFGSHRLRRRRSLNVALGGDDQRFIFAQNCRFAQDAVCAPTVTSRLRRILDPHLPNASIMRNIKRICQSQYGGKLYRCSLVLRQQVAQELMSSRWQPSAMESGHNGCALHIFVRPAKRSAVLSDQV